MNAPSRFLFVPMLLALAACFPPVQLPRPPTPLAQVPALANNLGPPPTAREWAVLETPGDSAQVAEYNGSVVVYDSDGNASVADVTRKLCVTPCKHDFRLGTHRLNFSSLTDPSRRGDLEFQLGEEPLIVRHVLEVNRGQWGKLSGLLLDIVGASLLFSGIVPTAIGASLQGGGDSKVPEIVGVGLLGLGAAMVTTGILCSYFGRGVHADSATLIFPVPATGQPAAQPERYNSSSAPDSAPPPRDTAAPAAADVAKRLQLLDDLKARKLIRDDEYQRERQRILDGAIDQAK